MGDLQASHGIPVVFRLRELLLDELVRPERA